MEAAAERNNMTQGQKPQWLIDYEQACWAVWSPKEFIFIAFCRQLHGYSLELDCDTMTIIGRGPAVAGGDPWHWVSERIPTIFFLDLWIEWGGDTPFLDWLMGHLWCLIDMPREMPPFPEEFFERGEAQNG